ncbi:MAG: 50S ribosomal protein L1 [Candidatus Saccharimonadales bacterium]
MERAGKRYKEAAKLIDKSKSYTLAEALDLAVKTANTKFDGSIEMHINLGVDPRQADQNVRDTVALPAGTGKDVRVEAISDNASAEKLFAKLDKNQIDFDVLVATPAMMPKLGRYARLLGPRGLMPNPKSGTVTQDVQTAVKEAKAGRVEYRVDQAGIVHLSIGKASFGAEKLAQNANAILASVRSAKPASLKGIYIKSIYVSSTMGPSVKIETVA